MAKNMKIQNRGLIHRGKPTPGISTKSKPIPVKNKGGHMDMPKPQQEKHRMTSGTPKRKITVTKNDQDVRAVGERQGYDAALFAKFGQSDNGVTAKRQGRSKSDATSAPRRRSPSRSRTGPLSEVEAVSLALAESLGAGVAPRPGLGLQPLRGDGERIRSASDEVNQMIRVIRDVR